MLYIGEDIYVCTAVVRVVCLCIRFVVTSICINFESTKRSLLDTFGVRLA